MEPAPLDSVPASVPLPGSLARQDAFAFVGRQQEVEPCYGGKEGAAGVGAVVLLAGEPGIGKTRLTSEVAGSRTTGAVVSGADARRSWASPISRSPGVDPPTPLPATGSAHRCARPVGSGAHAARPRSAPPRAGSRGARAGERTRAVSAVRGRRHLLVASPASPRFCSCSTTSTGREPAAPPAPRRAQHPADASPDRRRRRDTDLDLAHPLSEALADSRRTLMSNGSLLRACTPEGRLRRGGRPPRARRRPAPRAACRETEGNPFFIGEVLLHLVESGVLVQRDGRWANDLSLAEVGLPEGVREVICRRLSRLSERANEVLSLAAVIGRDSGVPAASPCTPEARTRSWRPSSGLTAWASFAPRATGGATPRARPRPRRPLRGSVDESPASPPPRGPPLEGQGDSADSSASWPTTRAVRRAS